MAKKKKEMFKKKYKNLSCFCWIKCTEIPYFRKQAHWENGLSKCNKGWLPTNSQTSSAKSGSLLQPNSLYLTITSNFSYCVTLIYAMGVCSGESNILWQHLVVLPKGLLWCPGDFSCFTYSLWELSNSCYFSTTSGASSGHRALPILGFLLQSCLHCAGRPQSGECHHSHCCCWDKHMYQLASRAL